MIFFRCKRTYVLNNHIEFLTLMNILKSFFLNLKLVLNVGIYTQIQLIFKFCAECSLNTYLKAKQKTCPPHDTNFDPNQMLKYTFKLLLNHLIITRIFSQPMKSKKTVRSILVYYSISYGTSIEILVANWQKWDFANQAQNLMLVL